VRFVEPPREVPSIIWEPVARRNVSVRELIFGIIQRAIYKIPGKTAPMNLRDVIVPFVVVALMSGAAVVRAEGNAAAGHNKTTLCAGCHGIPGYKSSFPAVYNVPKLGNQHAAYIVKALQGYKSGERSHPTMRAIAAGLTDQDMADLAAYYASENAKTAAK
jgi:cytochrome c553